MSQNYNNFSVNEDGTITRPQNKKRPQKPDTNMVWAILCTLFCCLPLGVVAIIYAAKVDGLYRAGDYASANEAAENAKKYSQYGLIAGIVVFLLNFIIGFAGAM